MNDTNSQDLVRRLAAIPYTGAISDILDEMGFHEQVLPKEIQARRAGQTVAGRALTVLGEPTHPFEARSRDLRLETGGNSIGTP